MDNFDRFLNAIVAVIRVVNDQGYEALNDPQIRAALLEEMETAVTGDKSKKAKSISGNAAGFSYASGILGKHSKVQLSGASFGTSESLGKMKEVLKPEIVVE